MQKSRRRASDGSVQAVASVEASGTTPALKVRQISLVSNVIM